MVYGVKLIQKAKSPIHGIDTVGAGKRVKWVDAVKYSFTL